MRAKGLTIKAFNKMSAAKRAFFLKKGFDSNALKKMAAAQADSFAGVMSTFQDSLQRFGGKVGKPLFKALTAEIKQWGVWIDNNQDKVKAFASELSSALKTGFGYMKSALTLLFRNRSLILTIAKTALILKATKFGLGKLGAFAEWGHALSGNSVKMAEFTGKLGNVIGKLSAYAPALAAAYVGAKAIAGSVDRQQETRISKKTDKSTFKEKADLLRRIKSGGLKETEKRWMGAAGQDIEKFELVAAKTLLREASRMGMISDGGKISQAGVRKVSGASGSKKSMELLSKYGADVLADYKNVMSIQKNVNDIHRGALWEAAAMAKYTSGISQAQFIVATNMGSIGKELYSAASSVRDSMVGFAKSIDVFGFFDKKTKKKMEKGKGPKTKIKIDIHRIEVQSDDPDRFVFQMMSTINDAVKNQSSALGALPEG